MKTYQRYLVIVAAAVLGLATGFVLRHRGFGASHLSSGASAGSEGGSRQLSPAKTSQTSAETPDDSALATKLAHDLAMSSGVTRWLYWAEALEKAAPGDFPRLLKLAKDNPGAMRFVATRWAQVAPQSFFNYLAGVFKAGATRDFWDLSSILFRTWAKQDPDALIAAINNAGDFGSKNWRDDVAAAVARNDAERGLALFSEWRIDNFGPNMTAIDKWAAADPRHAAEFTLRHPAGYASEMTMESVGKAWAATDPAGALQFAAANPGQLGSLLENTVLKEWAGKDLNAAADWLAATDDRTRNRLSPAFVESWAKKDAAAALDWTQENLSGSALSQSVGAVLKGAASKDPAAAGALVAQLDPSPARSQAAAEVARQWFPQFESTNAAKPEAVNWLAGLDTDSIRSVLKQIQWEWATSDPKSMAAFLATLGAAQVPPGADEALARQLVRKDPLGTLNWAASLPADRALTAGSVAYVEWRLAQPDAAATWFNNLAADDPRREPFFETTIRALAYDPEAPDRIANMSDTDKAAARKAVQNLSLPDDRRTRLLGLLSAH